MWLLPTQANPGFTWGLGEGGSEATLSSDRCGPIFLPLSCPPQEEDSPVELAFRPTRPIAASRGAKADVLMGWTPEEAPLVVLGGTGWACYDFAGALRRPRAHAGAVLRHAVGLLP